MSERLLLGIGVAVVALFENLDDRHIQDAVHCESYHNFKHRHAS